MTREVIPGGQRRKVSIWLHSNSMTQLFTLLLVSLAALLTSVSTYPHQNENVGKHTLDKILSPNVVTSPSSENWDKAIQVPIPTNPKSQPFNEISLTSQPENPIPIQDSESSKENSSTENTMTPVEFPDFQKSSSGDKQSGILSPLPLNRDSAFSFRFPSFSPEVDDSLGEKFPVGPLSILHEFERHHFGI